ncbi:MAG: hypothetical protein KJZ68_06910 [Phycisphaerales bacterium]|nr:hypothetical protein [Phycisphaerales bacterium]
MNAAALPRFRTAMLLGALLAALTWSGCRETAPPVAAPSDRPLRIASLSPALSRLAVDAGLGEFIVGRSTYCDMLPTDLPVIGNLYDVDFENLVRVRPTHLLVQPPATGVSRELEQVAREHGITILARRLNGVADVLAPLEDARSLLTPLEPSRRARARNRLDELRDRITALTRSNEDVAWRGRVLIALPGDPVLAFGDATYLGELVKARGGHNVVVSAGWVQLTLEDVTRLDPQAIIIVRAVKVGDPRQAAGPLADLDIRAVREGRLAVLSHPEASLPSTSVIEVAEELDAILHAWADSSELQRTGSTQRE